jgi:flagellar biosynthesis protein FlhF
LPFLTNDRRSTVPEENEVVAAAAPAKPPSQIGKMIIIVVLSLVSSIGGGVVSWYLASKTIAGHATARFNKKVVLVSTDVFRVGGQEQLNRFGALLGIPTYPCSDVATLKSLIHSFDDVDLVLVDTPGASPSDLARLAKLESALTAPEARVNLVISATTRSEDVARIIKRYQRFSPKRVVFTKIDETDSRGAMVGDLLRNELAISYLTNGQRVPEDLLAPSALELAHYVLPNETRRSE